MLPILTYPLALIALASLPALAAIYLLRNRFRQRTVSSLMLWQLQERSQEGGVKVQKVRLPWIFFLELLILALLVFAATGPRWRVGNAAKPLIVVLDDSASMLAKTLGGTPRERALSALRSILTSEAFQSVRFIRAGRRVSVLGSPAPVRGALDHLKDWRCRDSRAEISAGIALARELGHDEANILVITDDVAPESFRTADRLRWIALGVASPNLAFVNAARSLSSEGERCLLEIANLSSGPAATTLSVTAGSQVLREARIEIASNSVRRLVFNLPKDTPEIRASLSEDALAADNEVVLLPSPRERIRVRVAVQDERLRELVERTLAATEARAAISDSPHLVIHDQSGTPLGTNVWSARILASPEATALTGPFIMDTSHPVTRGVSLVGVVWAAVKRTNSPSDQILVTTDDQALITVDRDVFGREKLLLNLNPRLSTIAQSPDWPILFWNILEWRRAALPGLDDVNFRPGTDVRIRSKGDHLTLTRPGGEVDEISIGQGELIARAEESGLFKVNAAEGEWRFAVNFLAPEESDLRRVGGGEWGGWETNEESRRQYSSVLWLFALLGLSGMFVHHYAITHGRGRL